jgi:hypothetical protein
VGISYAGALNWMVLAFGILLLTTISLGILVAGYRQKN